MNVRNLKQNLINYSLNLVLLWSAMYFYFFSEYYENFLNDNAQQILLILAIGYTIFGLLFYLFFSSRKVYETKGYIIFRFFLRKIVDIGYHNSNSGNKRKLNLFSITPLEKTSILFVIVKIFFLPIMVNFATNNFNTLSIDIVLLMNNPSMMDFNLLFFNNVIFPMSIVAVFFIDTLYFSFGYTFEAGFLGNKIRSVEPTILGWAVALASYPPFNSQIVKYTDWYANDMVVFSGITMTLIIRIFILILFLIFLWATLALGTKCSNLTNRGIVARGPYKYVRHPAYIAKNIGWWITIIPLMSIPVFLSMSFWSFIYYLRAITEERHLMKDIDYQVYCKKVKYRFIPYVI